MCFFLFLLLQAEKAAWNSIGVFKISNISGKRRELVPTKSEDDSDMESDSDDSEDEEDGGSGTPVLQAISCFCKHYSHLLTGICYAYILHLFICAVAKGSTSRLC